MSRNSSKTQKRQKPGPSPERVKTDKDWEDAVSDALKKRRPKEGWPDRRKDGDDEE